MFGNIKKEKPKDATKEFLLFCVGFLIVLVVNLLIKLSQNKFDMIENYLSNSYYSKEHLVEAITDRLGEQCEQSDSSAVFFAKNFDNYVYSLVLDDINKYERDDMAKYNAYMNRTKADEILSYIEEPKAVNVEMMDNICYIKIPGFYKGFTYDDLIQYENELSGSSKFIIDLRDNTGGDIDELIDILSMFYEEKSIVYSYIGSEKITEKETTKRKIIEFDEIVFLCNEKTASASEVMMFNMQSDFGDKIKFVGQKTYGKNFCYSYKEFNDGELLMFVSGIMGNSRGITFDENGIIPDYVIDEIGCVDKAKELLE